MSRELFEDYSSMSHMTAPDCSATLVLGQAPAQLLGPLAEGILV